METVTVNAAALREVLMALVGPAHLIRELQVTRHLPESNPIDTLIKEYNAAAEAEQGGPSHD